MNDMYFDPADFDFTSLTDIVVKDDAPAEKAATKPQRNMNEYGGAVDDISDLTGFSPLPNDEPEEEDFNADVSDLEYEPEEELNEVTDYFNQAPDDAILTVGERSASKAELAELLAKKDEIEESHKALTYQAHEFNAGTRHITEQLSKLMTGAERQIANIDEALRNGNLDDKQYRYLRQRRDDEKAEKRKLEMLAQEFGTIRQQQEQLAVNNFVATSDQAMLRENPNWYQTKQQLLGYLIEQGALSTDPAQQHEFSKNYSIPNIKIWLKAMKADQNLKLVTEKAKAAKAKMARSTTSAVNTNREGVNVNIQAKKALSNMGASRKANVDAFAFLKD